MCTVSYLPNKDGYFITSNRDEKNSRSKAIKPTIYDFKNNKIIFPKDVDKGGTWIVLKENGDSLCLLNGAFTSFIDTGEYKTSRGKIVLDIASKENLCEAFKYIDLAETAPFTLVMIYKNELYEYRWDGIKKFDQLLNSKEPHIWSSATLYDKEQIATRSNWFKHFIRSNNNPSQENIIHFHTNTGIGDTEIDLVMNRNDEYFTVSITSISVTKHSSQMNYKDLISNETSITSFTCEHALG